MNKTRILKINDDDLTGNATTTIPHNGKSRTELEAIKQACRELSEPGEESPIPKHLKVEYDGKPFYSKTEKDDSGNKVTILTFGIELKTKE